MASQILNCIDRAAEMFSGSSNPFIPDAVHERWSCKLKIVACQMKNPDAFL